MALDPARTVAELRELRELTGDDDGAQRVAWTETWERARDWLRGPSRYLAELTPLEAIRAGRVDRAREALMALSAGVYL